MFATRSQSGGVKLAGRFLHRIETPLPNPDGAPRSPTGVRMIGSPFRNRHRLTTPQDRFARRPSRTVLVVVGGLLAAFALMLAAGGNHDAFHKVLVTKPVKRATTN